MARAFVSVTVTVDGRDDLTVIGTAAGESWDVARLVTRAGENALSIAIDAGYLARGVDATRITTPVRNNPDWPA